jgi:hypothetical protein
MLDPNNRSFDFGDVRAVSGPGSVRCCAGGVIEVKSTKPLYRFMLAERTLTRLYDYLLSRELRDGGANAGRD